jgi:hypothetical protein
MTKFYNQHASNPLAAHAMNMKEKYDNMNLLHMSLKIPFLCCHLDFFPKDLGAVLGGHGKRRHNIKWTEAMLADFC